MEIKESGIDYFKTTDEMRLALNGHFKTVALEKHPHVMVNLIMNRSYEKTFKNYKKLKISHSQEEKYKESILHEFKRYYGEWANIYDFSIKRRGFRTNFETIFKTEFGRLYGNSPGSIHDHIFYTSHCFEQYQERGDCYKTFPLLLLAYKQLRNTYPTPADMLRFLVLHANEYCIQDNFIFANVRNGVVVFEKLSGGILIAKTFLLPDMDFPKSGLFESLGYGFFLNTTDHAKEINNKAEKNPVAKVAFPKTDLDYNEYMRTMKYQLQDTGLNI